MLAQVRQALSVLERVREQIHAIAHDGAAQRLQQSEHAHSGRWLICGEGGNAGQPLRCRIWGTVDQRLLLVRDVKFMFCRTLRQSTIAGIAAVLPRCNTMTY